jgi:hypothetical protein
MILCSSFDWGALPYLLLAIFGVASVGIITAMLCGCPKDSFSCMPTGTISNSRSPNDQS